MPLGYMCRLKKVPQLLRNYGGQIDVVTEKPDRIEYILSFISRLIKNHATAGVPDCARSPKPNRGPWLHIVALAYCATVY